MTKDQWLAQFDNDVDALMRMVKIKARELKKKDLINQIVELRQIIHDARLDCNDSSKPETRRR